MKYIEKHPEKVYKSMEELIKRLESFDDMVESINLKPVETRRALELLIFFDRIDEVEISTTKANFTS